MNIKFRAANREDIDLLLGMMTELQNDDPWSCRYDEALARRAMDELLRDASLGRVWIVADGEEAVGYIVMAFDYSLEYQGKGAWVDEFYVQRSHRGKGVGARTLEFFVEQARLLGVKTVHLEVNHGNRAIELYRRLGFEEHERYLMTKWIAAKAERAD